MAWADVVSRVQSAAWRIYASDCTYVPPGKSPLFPCRVVIYPDPPRPEADATASIDPPPTGPRAEVLKADLAVRPERGGFVYLPGTRYEILGVTDSLDGRWRLQIAEVEA